MEPQNTGSFGANLGGISALKQAMSRRGLDASVLDQVSAAAPTEQVAPSAVPANAPQIGSVEGVAAQAAGQPQQAEVPFRSGEAQIALEALADTAKTESDIAKNILKLRTQGLA